MKTAKPTAIEPPSHRRSQPVRQTRTNPPRTTSGPPNRSLAGRDSLGGGHGPEQPIDIFPATTHFTDAITALPKELVRHFTLLKEVEAKIFAPEEALFRLAEAALNAPLPEPRPVNGSSSSVASGSAPMSAQNSSSGIVLANSLQPVPSTDEPQSGGASDSGIIPRRQLWRQTAFKINELMVSLEEKNHVITTANEALQKQLARIEDVWPHLEGEYSDEAKWGSTTHWAYPENRAGRASHTERARREGANAISAAAQAIAEEAAARSDARKQAVMAKKNLKTQQQESDFDDPEARNKAESGKKPPANSKVRKTATEAAPSVGLGITNTATVPNGNPPPKRRKVEKPPTTNAAPVERAMSTVFGDTAPKQKTTSPRETPVPEPKKRKALPNSNGQAKKSRTTVAAMSPSVASSPVMPTFPDPKVPPRSSPAPANPARPSSSRARQNSTQANNVENGTKARPQTVVAPVKANGSVPNTPDVAAPTNWPKAVSEPKVTKEAKEVTKTETNKEAEPAETVSAPPPPPPATASKKEVVKTEEPDRRPEPTPIQTTTITTVTKSGRASKPSTPALATFQDAARSRSSRNSETASAPKRAKKSSSTAQLVAAHIADEDGNSSAPGDEEDADADDPNEPTFCYCNRVSFGEMIACDAEGCEKEWFHLSCVGMRVAPKSNIKWYCDICKERMKAGVKKPNGR